MFVFATVTGTVTATDVVELTVTGDFVNSPVTVSYTVLLGDTLADIALGVKTAINANVDLQNASISADSDGVNLIILYPDGLTVVFVAQTLGAQTETLNLYEFLTLVKSSGTAFLDLLNQIDARTLIIGSGSPVVNMVVPRTAGVFYFDTVGSSTWRCDNTDGLTFASTTWSVQNFTIPSADHINTGTVILATNLEVETGTNDTKAITPLGAASRYAEKGVNASITEITGLLVPLGFSQGGGDWQTFNEMILSIFPNQTGNARKTLTTDGSGNLAWQPARGVQTNTFVSVSQTTKTGGNYVLNTDAITLTLPNIVGESVQVGDVVGFAPGNVVNVLITVPDGKKIMGVVEDYQIDTPYATPFGLMWTGDAQGWWLTT